MISFRRFLRRRGRLVRLDGGGCHHQRHQCERDESGNLHLVAFPKMARVNRQRELWCGLVQTPTLCVGRIPRHCHENTGAERTSPDRGVRATGMVRCLTQRAMASRARLRRATPMQPEVATTCGCENQTRWESDGADLVDPTPTSTMSLSLLPPCTTPAPRRSHKRRASFVSSRGGTCQLQAHALVRSTGGAALSAWTTGNELSFFAAVLIGGQRPSTSMLRRWRCNR